MDEQKLGGYKVKVFRDYSQGISKRAYITQIIEVVFREGAGGDQEYTVLEFSTTSRRTGYEIFYKMKDHFPQYMVTYYAYPSIRLPLLSKEDLLVVMKQIIDDIPAQKIFFSEKHRKQLIFQLSAQM